MSGRLREHLYFLKSLNKGRKWKNKVKQASPREIEILIEILMNLLANGIPVTCEERRRIMPHIDVFRHISGMRDCEEARQALLKYGYLFITTVLPAVFPLCGSDGQFP